MERKKHELCVECPDLEIKTQAFPADYNRNQRKHQINRSSLKFFQNKPNLHLATSTSNQIEPSTAQRPRLSTKTEL